VHFFLPGTVSTSLFVPSAHSIRAGQRRYEALDARGARHHRFHVLQEIPMAISMYQVSVPVFVKMLGNLSAVLRKAAAYAEAKKIEPRVLLDARLYPDMYSLTRQVQIACDNAKGGPARLAGVDVPKHEDNEASFDDLLARIAKTVAFLETLRAQQIDGSEERDIALALRDQTVHFKGSVYLLQFVVPNFYFHVTTAYAILRHNGIDVGKRDYLGST
jgi:uncharacterized protein